MFFKQLATREASLSYLFGCIGHAKAIAVDVVAGDEAWFMAQAEAMGAVGRPDLAGREAEMAGMLYDSLHSKLLALPEPLEIFPGHQAGSACGAGISGKPSSTIGFEKRWNPSLTMERAAFIASLTNDIPPRPVQMDRIVAANSAA